MRRHHRSFFLFTALAVVFLAVSVWGGYLILRNDEVVSGGDALSLSPSGTDAPGRLPAAASNEARALRVVSEAASPPPMALMMEALEEGFMPTQQVGEMGSLQGVLDTIYPMVYAETKYERLPGSPLIRFTDDMIWQSGDSYYVKRDAMEDQARHIQEASIALSVSPRIEMGQTTGYRLVEIPPDTLFSKIGMVSGDIILTINGTKPDMEPMALMFVNMVAGTHGMSTIQVEHRGVKRTLTIRASE